MSYYHGLRMKASEENPFGVPTGYAIYLEWDRERRETSDVLDISPEVTTMTLTRNLYQQMDIFSLLAPVYTQLLGHAGPQGQPQLQP